MGRHGRFENHFRVESERPIRIPNLEASQVPMTQCFLELLPFITNMCNASLQEGCLPLSQKHATVTPRLKKSDLDTSDAKNYRPVSNFTFMSEVVERLVCCQPVAFLERNSLLPRHQLACRCQHSSVLKLPS